MKHFALFTYLLVLLQSASVLAQEQASGLAFLSVGTNASAGAMGDAQVSNSADAFSTYWNPAGLAAANTNSAALSHHIWIAQTRTYAISGRFSAGENSGVGLFLTALDSGDLDERTGPGPAQGTFTAQFLSVGAAYGRAIGPARFGVTVKYLSERIFRNSADGYAFDFGMQVDLFQQGIKLGAALQHVGKMSRLNGEATELPQTLRAGISIFPFRVMAMTDGSVLLNAFITGEVSHIIPAKTTRYHIGLAAEVVELVTVRTGYITNDTLRGLTIGGGLGSNGLLFDYAFMPFDDGFDGPGHLLSLLYTW